MSIKIKIHECKNTDTSEISLMQLSKMKKINIDLIKQKLIIFSLYFKEKWEIPVKHQNTSLL